MLQGREQRILDELLGQVEIAKAPDQGRGQPTRFLAEDFRERGIGRDPGAALRWLALP